MNAESTSLSGAELVDELSNWSVGGGIVTLALFPLALPALALIALMALPLLVPVLAAGLVFGVVGLPVLLVRRLGRRALALVRHQHGPASWKRRNDRFGGLHAQRP